MMKKTQTCVRRMLLAVAGNECLYMCAMFFTTAVLTMNPLYWHQEAVALIERYVMVPWGMALCLLRLVRMEREPREVFRADRAVLFVLAVWTVVPFALRFGVTFNNMSSWHGFIVSYFAVYMMTSEESAARRERMMDLSTVFFTAVSLALGAAALYCAATAQNFAQGDELEYTFGVGVGDMLRMGQHHNVTGMIGMICTLMCLLGFCRRRNKLLRLVHLLGAAMMTLVVVLSQSRTSRYSLLAAFALGVYALLACGSWHRRAAVRHAAGLLAGVAVFTGGFLLASAATDAALAHYAAVRSGAAQPPIASAAAEETDGGQENAAPAAAVEATQARGAGDASFTGRTLIWKNLFRLWREDPKYMVIGNGMGRTGSRIVEGTIVEAYGAAAVHNTYLQFIADYGLIGFAMLAAFLCMQVRPCLRVLYARAGQAKAGDRVLVMIVAACLLMGLMESDPLASSRFVNIVLLFAFAQIMGRSLDAQSLVQKS